MPISQVAPARVQWAGLPLSTPVCLLHSPPALQPGGPGVQTGPGPPTCCRHHQALRALRCVTFGFESRLAILLIIGATHVKPHYGLTNTKLRAHLPLVVPSDPAPVLRVAQVTL